MPAGNDFQMVHSNQIQQGFETDFLKSSSNFDYLFVSMRNISWKFRFHSSIQSLFIAVLSFRVGPKTSGLQISLFFRDSYFQIVFAVGLTGAISRI